jgi:hypothetical protein|tara:strand:+ start:203 stop:619 length:417 start_codon:yes stop_codon:yes gene_type:complete
MIYDGKIFLEKDLFSLLKKNFIPDLQRTKKTNASYDCYSTKFNLDIELKCRRTHYDDLIIEKSKYKSLMNRSLDLKTIPVYINSTPKGIWAFYIAEIRMTWIKKNLPKQTDFSKKYHIEKDISYINIKEGIDLVALFP